MSLKGLIIIRKILSEKKIINVIVLTFGLVLVSGIFPTYLFGQGNLLVTPRRVVFEGNTKSIDLNLANIGQDSATYAISMVQIRMNEDGSFETITEPDPGQQFANKYIRYFPRSVTLPPNEAQVVKVQLVRTGNLKPGEYRSHFYFRSVPKPVALGEEEEPNIDTTSISVRLVPVFGITIPAIIRIGSSKTEITLSELNLDLSEDGKPTFSLAFNRSGNFSVYGDLTVDHVAEDGTVTRVGMANGIAVYTPNTIRYFKFNLTDVPNIDYHSGKLIVSYSSSSDTEPKEFAVAELILN